MDRARQFRKKPVVIEAEQYRQGPQFDLPFVEEDVLQYDVDKRRQYIATLEGNLYVSDGDWIIKGIKGEFYPCKPDIFAATYDALDAEAAKPTKQVMPEVPTREDGNGVLPVLHATFPSGTEQAVETGWLLEKWGGSGPLWITVENQMLAWTSDANKAIRLARKEDADMLAEIVDDCETITEHHWG